MTKSSLMVDLEVYDPHEEEIRDLQCGKVELGAFSFDYQIYPGAVCGALAVYNILLD